ncbi:MAG: HAMP domain-containing histidine kinase [Clostridia bacterium]|nr:HAMP domain-containing histidine kinase [Clostridia bacterium]
MKKFRNRGSGLFRKYLLVTISVILASFVFIGGALLLLVSKLWMEEKLELLTENVSHVAQSTRDTYQHNNLFDENSYFSVKLICNTLIQTSDAIDADIFIVNPEGEVVFCKDTLQSNLSIFTGDCLIHGDYKISPAELKEASSKLTASTGDLNGALDSVSFIASAPIKVGDEVVGVVYATQTVLDGLAPYVLGIFKMFFWAALFAFALAFVIVYLVSYRMTKPLREMSQASKQYANGDFSKRITIPKSTFNNNDEIEELVQAFNSMAQALATLEMSRRSFVSNVSHELKTPMTTIGGFIDGILDGTIEPEKQNQYLKIVSDEVKRLSRLVTGMLNMSKLEAGELDIKPVEFDISEMLFRTLLGFEQFIDKKHIEIIGLDELQTNRVTADKDMINQVVYNLIDNAVKFTPDGGYIEIRSKADAEKIIVKIKNSGRGIPAEELDKIFERFYKIDKSRSFDIKGAGMGLYLCKTIIELHGGQITARSREGEFAEFVFQLPLN